MTTNLPPHTVAQAIAELGRERLEQAWRYIHLWRVLTAAGVPVVDLRHALEHEHDKSEPCDHVERWQAKGGKGLAVLHGTTTGTGKTYAAVRWLIAGVDAGQRVAWLAAVDWPHSGYDRQQEWLDRGRKARRVVVDDIGAGTTGKSSENGRPYSAKPMESMIMGCIADGFSILLITNMSKPNVRAWLDDRNGSRMQMGGGMFEVKSRVDRRKPDETEVDEQGRSPTYHAHARLLEVIGCRRDGDGLVVGETLTAACERAEQDAGIAEESERDAIRWRPVRRAIKLLDLDRAKVFAHAREMQRREEKVRAKFRADMQREHKLDVEEPSLAAITSALMKKMRNMPQPTPAPDPDRSQLEHDLRRRMARSIPAFPRPEDVEVARGMAKQAGLSVGGNGDVGFWVVGEGVRLEGFEYEGRAWIAAAMHESKIGAVV